MPIKWNESYSVNNAVIDKQHQDLIDSINALHQAVRKADAENAVPVILEKLLVYVDVHFKTEEGIMKKCNYPDVAAHHDIHTEFKEHILKLQNDFKSRSIEFEDMLDLYLYLQEWINNHVLYEDKQLIPYISD